MRVTIRGLTDLLVMKPQCRYGALCERKNPDHRLQFSHPMSNNSVEDQVKSQGLHATTHNQLDSDKKTSPQQNSKQESGSKNNILLMLVGLPGSGKSTFCKRLLGIHASKWKRVCQDTISNGKQGTKEQCLKSAKSGLVQGFNVIIDRCNLNATQRHDFLELTRSLHVNAHALVLDLPVKVCIHRAFERTSHEGGLQGKVAPAAIHRMAKSIEKPSEAEGFSSIFSCTSDDKIEKAFSFYDQFSGTGKHGRGDSSMTDMPLVVKQRGQEDESQQNVIIDLNGGSRTLAFPSISTADFQFDHEKASEIIVETALDFLQKAKKHRLRLVMVDLKEDSDMLTRVRQKAIICGLQKEEFFTVSGDITRLYSSCRLKCNFIANAANWRLKPGGGGVNAAIFEAAGNELEIETKKLAKTLNPGSALVVPLPLTSPLYIREGVTHVIHVLGPNMNPQRPNCLHGDYNEGCKLLRHTYSCMFDAFASAAESQRIQQSPNNQCPYPSDKATLNADKSTPVNAFSILMQAAKRRSGPFDDDQKMKRNKHDSYPNGASSIALTDSTCSSTSRFDHAFSKPNSTEHGNEKNSHCELGQNKDIIGGESHRLHSGKNSRLKNSQPWAEELKKMARNPELYKDIVLQLTQEAFLIADKYPKGQKHFLVISREDGLDSIKELKSTHLPLLLHMHRMGQEWIENLLDQDKTLVFRMGYHSEPSMRQLHMHIVSQDFDSPSLKNKKHWNSFTTTFFRDSEGVMEELKSTGSVTPCGDEDSLMKLELRCHRCRCVQPNIPKLKQHIKLCQSPFPQDLVEKGYLIMDANKKCHL